VVVDASGMIPHTLSRLRTPLTPAFLNLAWPERGSHESKQGKLNGRSDPST
jgi:hypothetical protein